MNASAGRRTVGHARAHRRFSYALPVGAVREIVRLPDVTRVPGLPAFVAGLANVRGRVLAVLDLRPLLQLDAPRGERLVILDGDGRRAAATAVIRRAAGRWSG